MMSDKQSDALIQLIDSLIRGTHVCRTIKAQQHPKDPNAMITIDRYDVMPFCYLGSDAIACMIRIGRCVAVGK
jgi:hypothetical protein